MVELKNEFKGRGSVKGFTFKQISKVNGDPMRYVYEVNTGSSIHYEYFNRKEVKNVINFKTYETDGYKVAYPSDEAFGKWAWTTKNRDDAFYFARYGKELLEQYRKTSLI
jgi:hypothetical protein